MSIPQKVERKRGAVVKRSARAKLYTLSDDVPLQESNALNHEIQLIVHTNSNSLNRQVCDKTLETINLITYPRF